jgi:hypothetical protein
MYKKQQPYGMGIRSGLPWTKWFASLHLNQFGTSCSSPLFQYRQESNLGVYKILVDSGTSLQFIGMSCTPDERLVSIWLGWKLIKLQAV